MNIIEEFIFYINSSSMLAIQVKSINIYDQKIQDGLKMDNEVSEAFRNIVQLTYTNTPLGINSSDGQTPMKINDIDGYYKRVNELHVFSFGLRHYTIFFITNDQDYKNIFSKVSVTIKSQ
jgi:hypothetical protein